MRNVLHDRSALAGTERPGRGDIGRLGRSGYRSGASSGGLQEHGRPHMIAQDESHPVMAEETAP